MSLPFPTKWVNQDRELVPWLSPGAHLDLGSRVCWHILIRIRVKMQEDDCGVLPSVAEPKLLAPRVGSGADKSYKKP